MYICESSIPRRKYFAIRVFPLLGTLYQIRSDNPLLLSSGRDVTLEDSLPLRYPAERLYSSESGLVKKGVLSPDLVLQGFKPTLKF